LERSAHKERAASGSKKLVANAEQEEVVLGVYRSNLRERKSDWGIKSLSPTSSGWDQLKKSQPDSHKGWKLGLGWGVALPNRHFASDG